MLFKTPRCPRCGDLAAGTHERLEGRANITMDEDGHAEWDGYTTVFWDAQETVTDDAGRVTMICPEGHDWQSEVDWNDDEPITDDEEAAHAE